MLHLSCIKWLRLSPRLSRRAGTQSEHFMTYLTLSKVSGFQLLSLWEGVRGCGNNFSVQRPNLCLSCFKTNTDDPSLPGCKMEAMPGRLQKVKMISGALLPVNSETDFPQWKPDFLCQWKGGVAYICLDKGHRLWLSAQTCTTCLPCVSETGHNLEWRSSCFNRCWGFIFSHAMFVSPHCEANKAHLLSCSAREINFPICW